MRDIFQGKEKKEKPVKKPVSAEMMQVQTDLSDKFGTQVKVNTSDNNKGEIKIPFHSVEDLNRLLELLKN